LDAYHQHGPNWPLIESLLPARKGIVSKWKRLVATGNEEAISSQRWWKQQRDKTAAGERQPAHAWTCMALHNPFFVL
jgi:hypothetical protein